MIAFVKNNKPPGGLFKKRTSLEAVSLACFTLILTSASSGLAQVAPGPTSQPRSILKLASPFTNHMVLQRELPVPVWGTAEPGEEVAVEFAGQRRSAVADASGQWRVSLDPLKTSSESRSLKITGGADSAAVEMTDVLVGEVWLASGQSNMDFTLGKTRKRSFAGVRDEAAEIAAANYPRLRMFTGELTLSKEPRREIAGEWKRCTPENAPDFSAVAYFFARHLGEKLDGVPVGIVTLAYGASTAQAWVQREAITANPKLKPVLDTFDEQVKNFAPPTDEQLKVWQEAVEKAKAAGVRAPRKPGGNPVQDQHNPTVLFSGMIAPVAPFAVRGVIWYQGESITDPKGLFPLWNETLIKNWRQLWGRDLPFYFCQLAAQDAASNSPTVREMQAEALALPDTGMAVTVDIGERKNVHPKNKQDVGDRLARIALAKVYGYPVEWSGPALADTRVEGAAMRLKFAHADGGLIAKEGPLKTFEVAGADEKFSPAEAIVDGDSVLVQSAGVPAPVVVRYAWSNYPEGCNLYNKAGLPAAPFRTDKNNP